MEQLMCQSCGMPLQNAGDHGTNADKSMNNEFCTYCYQNGAYTKECTMEEMIQINVQYLDEFNADSEKKYTKEEAIDYMRKFFPTLKRWQTNK